MNRGYLLSALVVTILLTVLSGILQGKMRNRWGPPASTVRAAEKLDQFPTQFGDWRLQASEKLDDSAARMLECATYFIRTYRNQATGDEVGVTLLLGPPGPTSVHTPEICFPSQNYKSLGKREAISIPGPSQGDVFWGLCYKANNLRGDMVRVCYAWSTGSHWVAAGDPRFKYAGQPYLYKIQLSAPLPAGVDLKTDDPCKRFLESFVPVARMYLVEPPGSS